MQEASYSYIEFLPENKIILATAQSLLSDKYLKGLFGPHIFAYARDDSPDFILPSISVNSGEIYSYDSVDRIEGIIALDVYFGSDLIREKTTQVIHSTMSVIRQRIQNYNFAHSVLLNMVEYEKHTKTNNSENEYFLKALDEHAWLVRYGIEYRYKPANKVQIPAGSCYKSSVTFKYWLLQQAYYSFLEEMGIDGRIDPNKIVYNKWEEFYPEIVDIG